MMMMMCGNDTINENGTMSEAAQIYIGEDRFAARKKIIKELEEKGFLVKEEEYTTRLGYSQRTGVVVEPRISTQWFVKMAPLAEPAPGVARRCRTPCRQDGRRTLTHCHGGEHMSTLETLQDILIDEFDLKREQLTADAELAQLGVDSLDLLDLIFKIEDRYRLKIRDDVPINLVTVRDVVEFIDSQLARRSSTLGPGDGQRPVAT